MSSYEDYTSTSAHYDSTRVPIGVEIIVGCLLRGGRPLAEQTLVDAGCGTGSYSQALLEYVGRIEAVDMNEGMLGVARQKLAQAHDSGRVRLHHTGIDALPLEDASVDGVMINQVLHHLPDDPARGWPLTRKVVAEFARVLRPGGALVVNTCGYEQIRRGWWYFQLMPETVEAILRRMTPLAELEAMIEECGLESRGRFVPADAVIQGRHYFEARGPLDASWRAGDSIWAMLDEAELDHVLERVRDLDARDELESFVAEHDAERPHVGQVTFLYAVRR